MDVILGLISGVAMCFALYYRLKWHTAQKVLRGIVDDFNRGKLRGVHAWIQEAYRVLYGG